MSAVKASSKYRLRVNAFDRVSSLLVALLVIVALAVGGLLIVYFARQLMLDQVAIPVTPVELPAQPADATMGLKHDLEPPGIEEIPDFAEPQVEDTLDAITNAVANKTALLSDEQIDSREDMGHGRGLGDNRRAGPPGTGEPVDEPAREIRFQPESIREYAQWLDYFGIELGVLGRDNMIHYAYNLSARAPSVRTGKPGEEKRLYMNSARGPFAGLDARLAAKAGIADRGRIILQFYPPATQEILYRLERERAGSRSITDIRSTVFRVTRTGDRFEFSVEEQTYR